MSETDFRYLDKLPGNFNKLINCNHRFSISRQAKIFCISRDCVYHQPRRVNDKGLSLWRRIDPLYFEAPCMGSRMLRGRLNRQGIAVGQQDVNSLMLRLGIEPLYQAHGRQKKAGTYSQSLPLNQHIIDSISQKFLSIPCKFLFSIQTRMSSRTRTACSRWKAVKVSPSSFGKVSFPRHTASL